MRTGVTAIHPQGAAETLDPVQAAFFSFNGNGEMTGTALVEETGFLSTLSLSPIPTQWRCSAWGAVHGLSPRHLLSLCALDPSSGGRDLGWVPERHQRFLFHVRPEHAFAALDNAQSGPLEEVRG